MQLDNSPTSRRAYAAASALTVLTWYALPDAVRSRTARGVIKGGLLGASAVGAAVLPTVYPLPAAAEPLRPRVDLPVPAVAALGLGVAVASVAATVWAEKAIFALGERRRRQGVRCAHSGPAAAMALATGAAALVDWEAVVRRWGES